MVRHYLALCADAIRHPEKKIADLAMSDAAELAQLRRTGAVLPSAAPRDLPLAAHFARDRGRPSRRAGRRLRRPDGSAYRRLDEKTHRLAAALQARGMKARRPGRPGGRAERRPGGRHARNPEGRAPPTCRSTRPTRRNAWR